MVTAEVVAGAPHTHSSQEAKLTKIPRGFIGPAPRRATYDARYAKPTKKRSEEEFFDVQEEIDEDEDFLDCIVPDEYEERAEEEDYSLAYIQTMMLRLQVAERKLRQVLINNRADYLGKTKSLYNEQFPQRSKTVMTQTVENVRNETPMTDTSTTMECHEIRRTPKSEISTQTGPVIFKPPTREIGTNPKERFNPIKYPELNFDNYMAERHKILTLAEDLEVTQEAKYKRNQQGKVRGQKRNPFQRVKNVRLYAKPGSNIKSMTIMKIGDSYKKVYYDDNGNIMFTLGLTADEAMDEEMRVLENEEHPISPEEELNAQLAMTIDEEYDTYELEALEYDDFDEPLDWAEEMDDKDDFRRDVELTILQAYDRGDVDPTEMRNTVRNVIQQRRRARHGQESKYAQMTKSSRSKAVEVMISIYPKLFEYYRPYMAQLVEGTISDELPHVVKYRGLSYHSLTHLLHAILKLLQTTEITVGTTPSKRDAYTGPSLQESVFSMPNGKTYMTTEGAIKQISTIPIPTPIQRYIKKSPPNIPRKLVSARGCVEEQWLTEGSVQTTKRGTTDLASLFAVTRNRCDKCFKPGIGMMFIYGYGSICYDCYSADQCCAKCSVEAFKNHRNYYKISTWTLPVFTVTEGPNTRRHSLFCDSVQARDWINGKCMFCEDECQKNSPVCEECDADLFFIYYDWTCDRHEEPIHWEGFRLAVNRTRFYYTPCADMCIHRRVDWHEAEQHTRKKSIPGYSKHLISMKIFPRCPNQACEDPSCNLRHNSLLNEEMIKLNSLFVDLLVDRELMCHRTLYAELLEWNKANPLTVVDETVTQESKPPSPKVVRIEQSSIDQKKKELDRCEKVMAESQQAYLDARVQVNRLRRELSVPPPKKSPKCFLCGGIAKEDTRRNVESQTSVWNPMTGDQLKKVTKPAPPAQEAVLHSDPPVFDRGQVVIWHATDEAPTGYLLNGSVITTDVRRKNDKFRVILRVATVSHFSTHEAPGLDVAEATLMNIRFPTDHPLFGSKLKEFKVCRMADNDLLADIWCLFEVPACETDDAVDFAVQLGRYRLMASRWNGNTSEIMGANVKIVSMGTETMVRNVTSGKITDVQSFNDGQFHSIDHNATVFNPDNNPISGPGSSGSVVYAQVSTGSYKPIGLHFGIRRGVLKVNTCYSLPSRSPPMPKEVQAWT